LVGNKGDMRYADEAAKAAVADVARMAEITHRLKALLVAAVVADLRARFTEHRLTDTPAN